VLYFPFIMAESVDLKGLRKSLSIEQHEMASELGVTQPAYSYQESNVSHPRPETIARLLAAFNAILERRGSARRISYDELQTAILVGRFNVAPVAPPDTAADLAAIDAAPAAQPSAIVKRTVVKRPVHASDRTTDGAA
jgi:transcriptional regulator with XRE-family HTH domain